MTKLIFWQGSVDSDDENAFEHEKRSLTGVFEVELQEVREKVEQSVSPAEERAKWAETNQVLTIEQILEQALKRTPEESEQIRNRLRESNVEQTVYLSRYDRNKLINWFDAQDMSRDRIDMTEIQTYLRGFIVGIAFRIALNRKDSCFCRACGFTIKWEDMKREPWQYYVNPTFAGSGHFLICPDGHAMVTIQETIS